MSTLQSSHSKNWTMLCETKWNFIRRTTFTFNCTRRTLNKIGNQVAQ